MLSIPCSRRQLFTGASALGGISLLAACSGGTAAQNVSATASSTDAASSKFTIGITYTPNVQFAPFYMAYSQGEYDQNVSLRHHGAQEGLFDALLAGTEDLVIAGADETAVAAANGADLVIVGGYYQQYPVEIIVPQDSQIQKLSDLSGKTVGLPGRFGENWYALQLALGTANLAQDEVDIQEIGYTQQAALMTGKVDAIVGYSNNDAVQLEQADFPVRGIQAASDIPLIGASLVASRTVKENKLTQLKAAVQASVSGMHSFMEDPDGAVKATADYVPDLVDQTRADNAREVAVATAELMETLDSAVGEISTDKVSQMIAFLREQELLGKTDISAEQICFPLS